MGLTILNSKIDFRRSSCFVTMADSKLLAGRHIQGGRWVSPLCSYQNSLNYTVPVGVKDGTLCDNSKKSRLVRPVYSVEFHVGATGWRSSFHRSSCIRVTRRPWTTTCTLKTTGMHEQSS